jgi:hypothetical protein
MIFPALNALVILAELGEMAVFAQLPHEASTITATPPTIRYSATLSP